MPDERNSIRALTIAALLGGAIGLPLACDSSRDGSADDRPSFDPDAASTDAPVCGFRCSRDLKKVLKTCEGQPDSIQVECPPDQGCGVDSCVSACDAAALSKGSAGCGFWTLPPDDTLYGAGPCFVAMVANTWDRPVTISAEWGSEPLDITRSVFTASRTSGTPVYTKLDGALPPGQVALVFLSQDKDLAGEDPIFCPEGVTPALQVDPIRHGTTRTKAFHIETDAPVAAYSIFPYGGAKSFYPTATLLLPESSWEKTYIGVSPGLAGDPEASYNPNRTMQIVAAEDGTEVAIRPSFDITPGVEIRSVAAGSVGTWTLARGQVLQFTQKGLKSGSPIVSNKPVGVFGGSPCTFIPDGIPFCDMLQQQVAPFSQWGTEYALVPFRPRQESITGPLRELVQWSLVGAVDGTELSWVPERPKGAPDRLAAGQISNFLTDAIVTVKSQDKKHPFHAAVYMTGSTFANGRGGRTLGDPDFVNMVPSDQFLDRYVFFADYTFPETSLTIVRKKSLGGFKPVSLECGGELGPFTPIGDGSDYEYAWVRITSNYAPEKFAGGECGYGRHVIQSEGPFSVHVWGIGRDASYGYAGGMGSRPVNDAPPPTVQ